MQSKVTNNTIISPYGNSNSSQPQPSSKNKFLIIGIISLIVIVLIAIAIVAIINLTSGDTGQSDEEFVSAGSMENTPALQIYAALDENVPLDELEGIAKNIDSSAEVVIEGNGYGTITVPGYSDNVIFEYFADTDEPIDCDEEDSESCETKDEEDEEDDGTLHLSDTTSSVRYAFIIDNSGISISKSLEGDGYRIVDEAGDAFDYPTKEEAIAAYLSPLYYSTSSE